MMSDFLSPDYGKESLRYALIASSTLAAILAATAFLIGSRYLTADLGRQTEGH